ncbi:acetyl-CoA carboxylase biotin carboxyl carrier protein [Streptococcus pluranimalium]|uniref:Biotin carboxyl carrier protein of acetyl-CoA carboxylase n=1 Tax=Streptococcus pluranimalium TaxID=82348 RepID=A0A2L0D2S4_9STRE|nr:acetyl-CoA carboxylase biotin carboxyl carrier protein [Streptococcus pluranimalium]AUW95909.1 acetyl-CoA carboxylase biotin carboxyl carrier protein [Streptococcus pluranimalium]
MNLSEIKDLMSQFDESSLREFSFKQDGNELRFSKNERQELPVSAPASSISESVQSAVVGAVAESVTIVEEAVTQSTPTAEGDLVESPLVGVAYLAPAPDKAKFVSVGDSVKKGQTLMIIEAMKVMNEVPAPCDGVVTDILVADEDVIEYGQGLVRIK